MSTNEQGCREHVVRVCHSIYEKGWVAMNDGNVRVRLDEDHVLCTPTAVSKGQIQLDDFIVCDMAGNKVKGKREWTSEIAMNMPFSPLSPFVRSLVHAHPPVATG